MTTLIILVHLKAKPDQVDLIKSALLNLQKHSREDEGCLQYDVHQESENPAHFVLYERWASYELWQAHMNAEHLLDYKATIDGAFDELLVNELSYL